MARKAKKPEAGAPAWMVTFSDMVTLLLTFFVLLLSMANMDKVKIREAAGSLRGAFGVMANSSQAEVNSPMVVEFSPIDDDYVARLYQKIEATMSRLKIDEEIELVKDRGAVILRIKESVLFAPGTTALRPESGPVLEKVAGLVRPLPLSLRIEGHADSTPGGSGSRSNWDISVSRAISVLKFMADGDHISLDRMSAVGYGSRRGLVPNTTEENRALNRRVEFVLESLGDYREELPYLIDASEQLPF